MKNSIGQVAEFHKTFNHPISDEPVILPMDTVLFRINFIREELNELEKAARDGDIVEVADGLGDIQYVLDGFYLNAGMHKIKSAISTEIHRSNMSKVCTSLDHAVETMNALSEEFGDLYYEQSGDYYIVKRKSDGKVMKALGYSKPDIAPILGITKFPL